MIHAVRIADGKAAYCNRWVQTSRLQQEGRAGWPLVPKSEHSRGPPCIPVPWCCLQATHRPRYAFVLSC